MTGQIENWDDLRVILAVAQEGSYRSAAKCLNTTSTTVSRHVDRMTAEIGAPIFVLKQNKWCPTPLGKSLLEIADQIQSRIGLVFAEQRSGQETVTELRLGTIPFINEEFLSPKLGLWGKDNPEATLDIVTSDRAVSIEQGELDVMLDLIRPDKNGIMRFKLARFDVGLYRSKEAKSKDWVGLPKSCDHLPSMQMAHAFFQKPPKYRMNSFQAILNATTELKCYGLVLTCMGRLSDDVVQVHGFNKSAMYEGALWFAFHESRKDDAVVLAAKRWVKQVFPSSAKCLCGQCDAAEAETVSSGTNAASATVTKIG